MAAPKPGAVESMAKEFVNIDLFEDKAKQARISRGGIVLEIPEADSQKVDDFVSRLPPAKRPSLPRVVSQSPPAGTMVTPGTRVQVTIVPPKDIQIGLFKGMHADLLELFIVDLLPVIDDAHVSAALAKYEKGADVPTKERTPIQTATSHAATALHVTLHVDTTPQRNFEALFRTLQLVAAYG